LELEHELATARDAAAALRMDLLYGTSHRLVDAVGSVLEDAGFTVENLDETLGEGSSADLLASEHDRHWLIEVKAALGNPSEDLVSDLDRHMHTWSQLGRTKQLSGSCLRGRCAWWCLTEQSLIGGGSSAWIEHTPVLR
jgi:hypothetical protein